jgi:hypothetical protein
VHSRGSHLLPNSSGSSVHLAPIRTQESTQKDGGDGGRRDFIDRRERVGREDLAPDC